MPCFYKTFSAEFLDPQRPLKMNFIHQLCVVMQKQDFHSHRDFNFIYSTLMI